MADFFSDNIWNYFTCEFDQGYFQGDDDVSLRYVSSQVKSRSNGMILLGGRTEFAEKYAELFYDLRTLDCSLYSFDHRGQGLSQRLLDDRKKGHVKRFADYSTDLEIFLEKIVSPQKHDKLFLIAHSMGCTVACDYMLKHPTKFSGAVFCSPMFDIVTAPLPRRLSKMAVKMAVILGFGEEYIWGGKFYDPREAFEENKVTSCEDRFYLSREIIKRYPELELGGATYNWVNESFMAMGKVMSQAHALATPILVLQSGDDQVVDPAAQELFCRKAQDCRIRTFDGAKHELLMERDAVRLKVVSEIKSFLTERISLS